MLTKSDCMSILVRLEDKGVNIDGYLRQLLSSKDLPIDVLKFIAQNQGMETVNFYEMLRKRHNQKKSPLYTNILKEKTDVKEATTVLVCLLTQIILYGNKLNVGQDEFFRDVRAEEISRVLNEYFKTGDGESCASLLRLIKTDLLVLEYLNGRRELE